MKKSFTMDEFMEYRRSLQVREENSDENDLDCYLIEGDDFIQSSFTLPSGERMMGPKVFCIDKIINQDQRK